VAVSSSINKTRMWFPLFLSPVAGNPSTCRGQLLTEL